jgi:hypothetical protein
MNEHGAMMKRYDRGKLKVIQEKPVPAPLYPSQVPHGLASDQTRTSMERSQRLRF